jgi:putative aldouronate transport system substrate-binding protein
MKKTYFITVVVLVLIMMMSGCSKKAMADSGGNTEGELKKVTLTMFVDETWWPYRDWNGDMPQWMTSKTGIDFEVTVATNNTELPIMIASGSYPDTVVTDRNANLMSNSNVSYNWQELIDKYNIDWNIHPAYDFVNAAGDGKTYTIKCGWSADYEYEQYPTVWPEGSGAALRTDIKQAALKALGKDDIYTVEDLEFCLDYCKKNYPDVIPFVANTTFGIARFHEALYGACRSGFLTEDNQAKVYLYAKYLKPALLKMNEWFLKGWMVEENVSWISSSMGELYITGKIFGVSNLSQAAAGANTTCKEEDVDYRWEALNKISTLTSAEITFDTGWRGYYITKNCKYPESAILAAKFFCSKDDGYAMLWGFEGTDWRWNIDKTEAAMLYDNSNTELTSKRQFYWGWIGHDGISNNMKYMSFPDNRAGLEWVGRIQRRDPVAGVIFNKMDSDSDEYVIYTNLQELERTYFPKIIFAKSTSEALNLYNEMMVNADSVGGQRLNTWANGLFSDLNSRYEAIKNIGPEGWQKK